MYGTAYFGTLPHVLPANAPAWIDRLLTWLEPFESAFGHVAQRGAFRRYLLGLLSDSPRKSMSAMLARVSDPGSYQAFQHFITSAPWAAEGLWRQLRRMVPAREGVLIFDGTSFPKQGDQSVGVARQYCGALGKIANCQVAVTAALCGGISRVSIDSHQKQASHRPRQRPRLDLADPLGDQLSFMTLATRVSIARSGRNRPSVPTALASLPTR